MRSACSASSLLPSAAGLLLFSIQHRRCRNFARAGIRVEEDNLPFAEPLNYHVAVVGTFVLAVIEFFLESCPIRADAD